MSFPRYSLINFILNTNMTTGSYYKFNNTGLDQIFASNSNDYNYSGYIANYTYNNTTIGPYNGLNGTWTKQTDIPFNVGTTPMSISTKYSLTAKYIEYPNSVDTGIISIPVGCKSLKFILIGAGGSGGAGGGDKSGQRGTDGAGGGGGGIWLGEMAYNAYKTYRIQVGKGGASVSGGATSGDSNNGYPGISGDKTMIIIDYTETNYFANGGGGGDGGHPSSGSSPGLGAPNNQHGAVYSNGGYSSSGMSGGDSPYLNYITYYSSTYPQLWDYVNKLWGEGGDGTSGGGDPNTTPTGAGKDGYARIYFIF